MDLTAALSALIAVLAALAGSVFTYVRYRRRESGKIATSEAADLWRESTALRKELYGQVRRMRKDLDEMRIEYADLQAELAQVQAEYADCTRRLAKAVAELERKRDD